MQQVVIVDVDGTLVKDSLERWFLGYLLKNRHTHVGNIIANLISLLIRWPLPQLYQLKLVYLRGQPVDKVEQWIQSCWKTTIQKRLYFGMVEFVRWLQSAQSHVVLLTGTPHPLAAPLMELLQIQEAICAEPEIENNSYTGRLLRPHPRGVLKAKYADNWLRVNGYTWDQVTAIGDSWQDRFLLSRAGHAIVIQPGKRLRRIAKQKSWLSVYDPNDKSAILTKVKNHFFGNIQK